MPPTCKANSTVYDPEEEISREAVEQELATWKPPNAQPRIHSRAVVEAVLTECDVEPLFEVHVDGQQTTTTSAVAYGIDRGVGESVFWLAVPDRAGIDVQPSLAAQGEVEFWLLWQIVQARDWGDSIAVPFVADGVIDRLLADLPDHWAPHVRAIVDDARVDGRPDGAEERLSLPAESPKP